jgi:hypothetical protein
MKYAWLAILVLGASCDNMASPPVASMPWVHGFNAGVVSDTPTQAAARRMADLRNVSAEDAYGAIELRADIAGDSSIETVLVSHRLGVVVLDSAGRVMASAPGLEFSGSADDVVSVAVGDGHLGAPLIIVAVQAGGHRERTILLSIYQLHRGKVLEQLFSAPIEEDESSETTAGSLTFLSSGLAYRAPGSRYATQWTFDVRRQRYIERKAIERDAARPSM